MAYRTSIFDPQQQWADLVEHLTLTVRTRYGKSNGEIERIETGPPADWRENEAYVVIRLRNPLNGRRVTVLFVGDSVQLNRMFSDLFWGDVLAYLNWQPAPLQGLRLLLPSHDYDYAWAQQTARRY